MAIESVAEMAVARPPRQVAAVPERARLRVEQRPQRGAIDLGVRLGAAFAEKAPERGIVAEPAQSGDLQVQEGEMGVVEIDGVDLPRLRDEVGQRVAAAGGDGDQCGIVRQIERFEVGLGIFPDLVVDEPLEPDREEPVPHRRFAFFPAVIDGVGDQLRIHPGKTS